MCKKHAALLLVLAMLFTVLTVPAAAAGTTDLQVTAIHGSANGWANNTNWIGFQLNRSLDLSQEKADVIITYEYLEDGQVKQLTTETDSPAVYTKNKYWAGYLVGDGDTRYSSGVKDVTPDYDENISNELPADMLLMTNLSNMPTKFPALTAKIGTSVQYFRVHLKVVDEAGVVAFDGYTNTIQYNSDTESVPKGIGSIPESYEDPYENVWPHDIKVGGTDGEYQSISDAVKAAAPNVTIEVAEGTYEELIIIDKPLTIKGTNAVIKAPAATLAQEDAQKNYTLVTVTADGVTLDGLSFEGDYQQGGSQVSRGVVPNAGRSELTIENCEFKNLRQPAYLEGPATIQNNYVENTKGWVVCSNFAMTFAGNSFKDNAVDIAIIPNGAQENNFADIAALSAANNGAYVENQVSQVSAEDGAYFLDAAGNDNAKSLAKAVAAAKDGDVIKIKPGIYSEATAVSVKKSITIQGDSTTKPTFEGQISMSGDGLEVTIQNLNMPAPNWAIYASPKNSKVTIEGCEFTAPQNPANPSNVIMAESGPTTQYILKDNVFSGLIRMAVSGLGNNSVLTGNTFDITSDRTANGRTSIVSFVADGNNSKISVTGNTFKGANRAIAVDNAAAAPASSFEIENNKFIDVRFAFEVDSTKNTGIYDLSKNYYSFDGEVSDLKVQDASIEGDRYNWETQYTGDMVAALPYYLNEEMTQLSAGIDDVIDDVNNQLEEQKKVKETVEILQAAAAQVGSSADEIVEQAEAPIIVNETKDNVTIENILDVIDPEEIDPDLDLTQKGIKVEPQKTEIPAGQVQLELAEDEVALQTMEIKPVIVQNGTVYPVNIKEQTTVTIPVSKAVYDAASASEENGFAIKHYSSDDKTLIETITKDNITPKEDNGSYFLSFQVSSFSYFVPVIKTNAAPATPAFETAVGTVTSNAQTAWVPVTISGLTEQNAIQGIQFAAKGEGELKLTGNFKLEDSVAEVAELTAPLQLDKNGNYMVALHVKPDQKDAFRFAAGHATLTVGYLEVTANNPLTIDNLSAEGTVNYANPGDNVAKILYDDEEAQINLSKKLADVKLELETTTIKATLSLDHWVQLNSEEKQRMKIAITSGTEAVKSFALGDQQSDGITFTTVENNGITYVKTYTVEATVLTGQAYTVTMTGDGYRTAETTDTVNGAWIINAKSDGSGTAENKILNFTAGEIKGDQEVDLEDLSAVASNFNAAAGYGDDAPEKIKFDLDRNGVIDITDIVYVIRNYHK